MPAGFLYTVELYRDYVIYTWEEEPWEGVWNGSFRLAHEHAFDCARPGSFDIEYFGDEYFDDEYFGRARINIHRVRFLFFRRFRVS